MFGQRRPWKLPLPEEELLLPEDELLRVEGLLPPCWLFVELLLP